jgi:probable rRNA maturation factor
VLSFESGDPESLGELVFCPEVLETQAKEHKQSFDQELGLMLVHGVLHLLGFDHENGGDDEKKMISLQDEVFKEIFTAITKPVAKPGLKSAGKVAPKKKTTASKK